MTSITKYARGSSGNHSEGEGGSKKSCTGSYGRNEVAITHLDLSKKTSLAYTRFGCTCKKFSAAQTPSPPGWKHHWIGNLRPGAKRQTTGASEGDYSQALQRSRPRDFDRPGQRTKFERDETRLRGTRSEDSIP